MTKISTDKLDIEETKKTKSTTNKSVEPSWNRHRESIRHSNKTVTEVSAENQQ